MAAGALHVGASGSVKEAFDWKCYLNCYKIEIEKQLKSKFRKTRKFLNKLIVKPMKE